MKQEFKIKGNTIKISLEKGILDAWLLMGKSVRMSQMSMGATQKDFDKIKQEYKKIAEKSEKYNPKIF